jgi:hypothetical protein
VTPAAAAITLTMNTAKPMSPRTVVIASLE